MIKRFSIIFSLIMLSVFVVAGQAQAATLTVNTTADELNTNGQCSLREAITNINNGASTYVDCAPSGAYGTGDTINIPAGTYTITIAGASEDNNATGDFDLRRNMAIAGAGFAGTFIDGGGLDRVFHVVPLAGVPVISISGVTVQNGSSLDGGGIYNVGGSLTIANSTVSGNATSGNGGGMLNNSGTTTVTNCTISNNTAVRAAGGILNNQGTLTVTNSTISNNSASADNGGGGIFNGDTATVTSSTITGNTSATNGGGIVSFGPLTVTGCNINGNAATGNGGGIGNYSTLTVTNSTISENTTDNMGGGIYNSGTLTLAGSTLSGNAATTGPGWGGGLFNGSNASLTNVTISGNQALNHGAGIFTDVGTTNSIINCTIADNHNLSGGAGAGIFGNGYSVHNIRNTILSNNWNNYSIYNCYQVFVSLGYNLSSDGNCYNFTQTGDMQNTNPLLGPLQDNGGPTFTHALLDGSPAIDAGDPNNFPETDQRGITRPQGSWPDIGAVEEQTEPLPDLTGNWYEPITEQCREKLEGLICKVKGRVILTNIGDTDAQNVKVRFYLSGDGSLDEGDILLKEGFRKKIVVGKERKMKFRSTLPVGMSLQGRYIIVHIDADETTEESNESNNIVLYGEQMN